MKTNKFFICAILTLSSWLGNAQATESDNNITSGSYLGTSNNEDVVFKRDTIHAGTLSVNSTSFGVGTTNNWYSTHIGVRAGGVENAPLYGGDSANTFIGYEAGYSDNGFGGVGGFQNSFLGFQAGMNSWGFENTFIGRNAGTGFGGETNTVLGSSSGIEAAGYFNTLLGPNVGDRLIGNRNIIIGYQGQDLTIDNQLIIENNAGAALHDGFATNPLIWGDFAQDQLKFHAKVGIGGDSENVFGSFPSAAGSVDVSGYNLFVKGGILTEEVRVTLNGDWADYVFAKNYKLKPLADVEQFIKQNGHLPNVPSAQKVKEDGIELGDMAKIQQEKIEELTLYIIEQNKLIQKLSDRLDQLEKR